MENLLEFMFGASGRITRAKYWRSLLNYTIAGLLAAVVLFTAAGIAAPLFIVMLVLAFFPWLMWGFAIHTERLHDRDKSAWWLVVFFQMPGAIGQLAKMAWSTVTAGMMLYHILELTGFALTIWGFIEIGCLRGTAGSNSYGADPIAEGQRIRPASLRY
jgi:uncharacterized membrane protein YhaH (DUF805 family)